MNQELNKKLVKELMKLKGEVRGAVLKTDGEYVFKEKKKEGLKKLENELEKLGQPIKYKKINSLGFYPIGLRIVSLLAIKKIFGFDKEKIRTMGNFATKASLIVQFFMKYFLSIQRVFKEEGPKLWRKHWSVGELIPVKLDEKKKYAVLRVENFNLHPIYCCYLKGYFVGMFQMMIKSPRITCQETKCSFQGDKYHQFLIKWL